MLLQVKLLFVAIIYRIQANQLIGTHVIYRHGDRGPLTPYPTSPAHENVWPNGRGQLTPRGQWQQVRLGRLLRQRYSNLLNSTYKSTEIYVRSSDADRNLASAYSNLLGLFPTSEEKLDLILANLTNTDEWSQILPWQPIPVHTVPADIDYLMGRVECPKFFQDLEELKRSEKIQNLTRHYRSFFDDLQVWAGMEVKDIFDAWFIADTVQIEYLYNREPCWATDSVLQQLKTMGDLAFGSLFSIFSVNRLQAGPFLREVIEDIQRIITNQSNQYKAKFYSSHDVTIAAALGFLGVPNVGQPGYSSALAFDLYKLQDHSYAIQVQYLPSTTNYQAETIRLSGCSDDLCPINVWSNWLNDKLPSNDMITECQTETVRRTRLDHIEQMLF